MRKRTFEFLAVALISVMLGTGVLLVQRPAAAQGAPATDPAQFARGAQTWADNCARCHNMRDPRELRDDQWRVAIAHMRVRANLTGEEARDVLTFLQQSN